MEQAGMTGPVEADVDRFRREGVVVLRRAIDRSWLNRLSRALEDNMSNPGPMASDYTPDDGPGRYFGDYCNWQRIAGYRDFVTRSGVASMAARLMGTRRVRFFHEHVLVKEPGTEEPTPWHHDLPYYVVDGTQVVSLWIPLDPVPEASCPQFVSGSHRWGRLFYPRKFVDGSDYAYAGEDYQSLEEPDGFEPAVADLRSWSLEPGDAIAFHFLTVHNAPPNRTGLRRRAIAWRFLGDDVRWKNRPGTPSPPYPDMGLELPDGAALPEDWFPVIWSSGEVSHADDNRVSS